ncbi:MAG: rRNA pseudouridine synthase [Candidatus Hydrogenedentes bacterium]|nr:rRNA pseudouridine synthase [Candidatus Hydrogenedentota bacterium]
MKPSETSTRLQKYLAACGVASRRHCESLIKDGRVKVNGETALLGATIVPGHDHVLLDNKPLHSDDKTYILLNKPAGTVTTLKDTHARNTVTNCLKGVSGRVFPVGRLDMDVEGALLLTNDGELAYRLTHPKYEIDKVYLAWVVGRMPVDTAEQLEQGVYLEDGLTAPAKVEILYTGKRTTLIRLVLHEGRKRQVKRMCKAAGYRVKELQRIVFANLRVKGLQPGRWRYLSPREIEDLRHLVGLGHARG